MSVLTKRQRQNTGWKVYTEHGRQYRIKAEIRHDDDCGNGHNSFAITGEIERKTVAGRWVEDSCGCLHEEIGKHFPKFAPLMKWHLTSTDGPIHYIANTVYHASNRDCRGFKKGEACGWDRAIRWNHERDCGRLRAFPIPWSGSDSLIVWLEGLENFDLTIEKVCHPPDDYHFEPKYTFLGFGDSTWHECPFDSEEDIRDFRRCLQDWNPEFLPIPTEWSKGSKRDLDAARDAACWPEATDEELSVEPEYLILALESRLPALMKEFQEAVESLGMVY